ncbi:MAG TPA: hypothetical protein PLD88_09810, partial [Candidatus Berkiella sp.]|nr:hypothetical protein [Candidatus Berkiella sp.]
VRAIIAAGLNESIDKQAFLPHLFDTPLKIHRSACELQTQLMNIRREQCVAGKALLPYFRKVAYYGQNKTNPPATTSNPG